MSKKRKENDAGGVSKQESAGDMPAIPEVPLRIIFQHLGVKDLLDCRVVNKDWSVIAKAELRTRRALFLNLDKLRIMSAAEDELRGGAGKKTRANLTLLAERLQADRYFPFLGVIISRDNWVGRRDVPEFCRNYGNFFERLYLKRIPSEAIAELLSGCFPNVRDLVIEPKPGESFGSCFTLSQGYRKVAPLALDGEEVELPSLESLTIVDNRQGFVDNRHGPAKDRDLAVANYSLIQRIIEATPNLRKLDNFHFWLYPCLNSCGKLETINKLSVDYNFYSARAHYVNFAQQSPPLTSLEIYNSTPAGRDQPRRPRDWNQHRAQAESLILAASQNTLEHLAIEKLSGRLPLLASLKSLWILPNGEADGEPEKIFDIDGPVSSYFPALETVRICMDIADGEEVDKYFQSRSGPCLLETVETLELLGVFDASAFTSLTVVFPNIKRLRVHWKYFVENNKQGISSLWTCSWNLTELEIYGYRENGNTLPELEAFVTGIEKGELKKLRHQLNQAPAEPAEIDVLRTKPSICNLTGLKTFRVFFTGTFTGTARRSQDKSGTAVPLAISYAFGLMPDLKTVFGYDFRADSAKVLNEALAPYSSVVSIQHRDEEF